jgi:prepilin-type N-terminal cleavage/methylation domain-containing protein
MSRLRRTSRAFTLIEVTMAVVILAIIAASVVPLVFTASDNFASAANIRRTAEKTAYAMERACRMLRDAPVGGVRGTIDLAIAEPSRFRYADGTGMELSGSTLYERATDGTLSPLCDQVSDFTIEYLASDGVTSTEASPQDTQRFNITIVCNGFELRSAAFARVRVVDP